jgi:type VI secretion system protein ImpA
MQDLEPYLSPAKESPPCGPNLEHDLAFFELEESARGKAEQRIGDSVKPGEGPDWPKVEAQALGLLHRTRDLRVAVHLTRALTRTRGIPGLAAGLGLVHGLLERYWDHVHPQLEADLGDDPTERLNALAPLADPGPLADPETLVIEHLRDTVLASSREHGHLRAREVEMALGRLAPARAASAGPVKSLSEIHAQIAAAFAGDRAVPSALRESRERVLAIQTLVADRVGAERAIDLKQLAQCVESLVEVCDAALGIRTAAVSAEADGAATDTPIAIDGGIRSRQDALLMLDLVCQYLERHEPTNPAPLFIRRAQRLMTKSFVEIVRDLLPDSLSNLERLAGEIEDK